MMACASCNTASICNTLRCIEAGAGVLQAQKTQGAHRIAGVDRRADAVLAPQRAPAVAQFVAVFDVVVNQRIVMEDFDGDGGVERVLDRRAFAERNAQHHLRPQAFARRAGPYAP